jgi:hypothetical protein
MRARSLEVALGGAGLALLAASSAAAQCALCGSATPYAGTTPRGAYETFLVAALVLLVPVMGIVAAFAGYLWKHREPRLWGEPRS